MKGQMSACLMSTLKQSEPMVVASSEKVDEGEERRERLNKHK